MYNGYYILPPSIQLGKKKKSELEPSSLLHVEDILYLQNKLG